MAQYQLNIESGYNPDMPMTVAEIVAAARQLPDEERESLVQALQDDELAEWEEQFGEPDPEYDARFRAGVEEALADDSPYVSHEEAMAYLHNAIEKARVSKAAV
jgi:hypothetical protein